MTTTNIFLNFGGKWDSPPSLLKLRGGVELWKVLSDLLILLNPIRVIARATGLINQ